jgi:hypothetical protein
MNDDFLIPGIRVWAKGDTINWLNEQAVPLFPNELLWRDAYGKIRHVVPVHGRLIGGYGYWLATGPQFPGLFELIHRLVLNWSGGAKVPTGPEILAELNRIRAEIEGQGKLFDV